ncbi:MAG: hypothetical protein WD770_06415, partial [Actinomycetota bacterium]
IPYREGEPRPDIAGYAALARQHFGGLDCDIVLEPGRLIAGNAGILVTEVLYLKEGAAKAFVVVDAAMNDLIRPTLYDAYHAIRPLTEPASGTAEITADVVGPVCESGDYLALGRHLPAVRAGDRLAILGAGAYGATVFMAAEAPGGRYGSVGIGIPPCSTANVSVGRGVGHATLTGGTRPQELTCPNFGETVTSWNPRATTWRFTGRMAGETTLVSTRLFVLDFTKAFLRSLR